MHIAPFVDVVNISYGIKFRSGLSQPQIDKSIKMFEDKADVLFVVAAPNKSTSDFNMARPLTSFNWFPSSLAMDLQNVIAIGGSKSCYPFEMHEDSFYGERIEMLAPWNDIIEAYYRE